MLSQVTADAVYTDGITADAFQPHIMSGFLVYRPTMLSNALPSAEMSDMRPWLSRSSLIIGF